MPTELVLLCDVEPASVVVAAAGEWLGAGGSLVEHQDGQVLQWVDTQGRAVLSLFAARRIEVRADADRAVVGGTGDHRWWVEMTVPYGDAADGLALARAVAEAAGGRVVLRA